MLGLRRVVCSPPPSEPDVPVPEHPALHRTCVGRSRCAWSGRNDAPVGWWAACSRGRPGRSQASRLVPRHCDLTWPVEPRALVAAPVASPVPSPDLLPGEPRVLLAQPSNYSHPQVVVEVSEGALARGMSVIGSPAPKDRVERVKQRVEREVRRVASCQLLDAASEPVDRFFAWEAERDRCSTGSWQSHNAKTKEVDPLVDVGDAGLLG